MKKFLSAFMASVMAATMLAGCGSKPASASTAGAASATEPKQVVEVVLPTYRSGEDAGAKFFLPQVERFNKKYEGVYHITVEESPSNTHTDRIKQLALQDKLPTVFQVADSKWVKDYLVANDKLEDLGPFIESKPDLKKLLIKDSVDFCTKDGKVVALPLTILKAIGMYYNTDMVDFGDKKVTELNWDEFAAALKDTKIAFQTAEGGWTINLVLTAMIGGIEGGAELLNQGVREKKITNFEDPIFIEAFTELQKLYKSNGWEGAVGATYPDAATGFYGKKSSVLPDGTWIIGKVNDPTDWSNGFDGTKVSGSYYPNNVAISNPAVYDWMMPAGLPEDQKEAGLAFFEFIYTPEEIEAYILSEGGSCPNLTYSDSFKKSMEGQKLLNDFATGMNAETKSVPNFNDAISESLFLGDFTNFTPKLLKGEWTPEQFATELSKAAVALE
ncbi:MAG: ABC transporter substrate-binding protein [Ruthenibacterium sp.]